ncbi:MAG TPA: MCE family protein [Pseudonocardia sp.]|nr:MCE family protein [Pseudonocardia sp.]
MRPVRTRLVAAGVAAAMLTSGCGIVGGGLRGVELPGGAELGDAPYELTVEFADVVDLVPQSLVKVNDVSVGTVTGIELGPDWTALVTVLVNGDVRVPADAQARVRSTSLLGEKFVELLAPDGGAGAVAPPIADGATIPLARTGTAAEVEEVLGALSMLLNGGGVAQIRTIAVELNAALAGNEPEIRLLLDDVDALAGALDERRTEITRALDELNRLGATLNERRDQIAVALSDLGPGLAELEEQRGLLVDMLRALDRLSVVATDVVDRSREDVVADLELLRPILENLAAAGDDLPKSLEIFFTPPFTDAAIDAFAGDYANLYVRADLDLSSVLENLRNSNQPLLGPDGPFADLPPTSQLLAPLLGSNEDLEPPRFPLFGEEGELPVPGVGPAPPDAQRGVPPGVPEPQPERELLSPLLGGGS